MQKYNFELEDTNFSNEELTFDFGFPNLAKQMLSTLFSHSIDLTKLIIDNRVRNSERLTDDDVYELYSKSVYHVSIALSDKNL
jgi:hypothetical protein